MSHEHTHEHSHHHVVPISTYLTVFSALMVLLIITVVAAFIPLGAMNLTVAMTIAVLKAVLIVLFFMHVKYGTRLIWVFSASAFGWLLIMFFFLMSDYLTRGWFPVAGK